MASEMTATNAPASELAPPAVASVGASGATTRPQTPPRRIGALTPLRHRNFSLLFSGQVISMLGDQAYGLALPWTVLVVTGDPRQVGIVLAAGRRRASRCCYWAARWPIVSRRA